MVRWLAVSVGLVAALGFDWRVPRGDDAGTMHVPQAGAITGRSGGFPQIVASAQVMSDGFKNDESLVGNFDLDASGGLEVLGISQGRVYLFDADGPADGRPDGTVLAASDTIPGAQLIGVYDLDGDGYVAELVVAAADLGGGVVVLDSTSLAELWRSEDTGGQNAGVDRAEMAVTDMNADGLPEILWNPNFQGFRDFHVATFADGMLQAAVTQWSLPSGLYSNVNYPAVGNFFGTAEAPVTTAVVQAGPAVTFFSIAEASASDVVDCSAIDMTFCLAVTLDATFSTVDFGHTHGWIGAVDVDDDGVDEYVSAGSITNPGYSGELTLLSPKQGLASGSPVTASAVRWAYRYGINANSVRPYGDALRDVRSSTGEHILAVSMYGDGTTETGWDPDGTGPRAAPPADDCLDYTTGTKYGMVVFDAQTGRPLAVRNDVVPYGAMDADGDGTSEIVAGVLDASGTATSTSGYELVCSGAHNTSAWSSCGATGCTLVERWNRPGAALLVRDERQRPDEFNYAHRRYSQPAIHDFTGDGRPELLIREGTTLRQYAFASDGTPSLRRSVPLATCGSAAPVVVGEGTASVILFEGTTCYALFDADLGAKAPFTVSVNQGSVSALTAHLNRSGVESSVLAVGSKIWLDGRTFGAAGTTSTSLVDGTSTYSVARAADFDADGTDEWIAYRTLSGVGAWEYAVFRWNGTKYALWWRVRAVDVGDPRTGTTQMTTGDFDDDGDDDLAVFVTVAAPVAPGNGRLYFFDGQGQVSGTSRTYRMIGSPVVAPATGTYSDGYAGMWLHATEACASCPGDEVFLPISSDRMTAYNANTGHIAANTVLWATGWAREVLFGDFDGDGAEEAVAFADLTAISHQWVAMYELNGTMRWRYNLSSGSGTYEGASAADINRDGALDVVFGNAFGGVAVVDGRTGEPLPGFPYYLLEGTGSALRSGSGTRHFNSLITVDIDRDGYDEAVIAHDDGFVYAVNIVTAEGPPSLAWKVPFGIPVSAVRAFDIDLDGDAELWVTPDDGRAYVIDGGDAQVRITTPAPGECVSGSTFIVSGTSNAVTQVLVENQCDIAGAVTVSVGSGGAWSSGALPWVGPEEATCTVRAYGLLGDAVVTNAAVAVTHSFDNDGDGYSPVCSAVRDCNDSEYTIHPGATEIECDGIDQNCDGLAEGRDATDYDLDGVTACSDCNDRNASIYPGHPEIPYDGEDNDCRFGDLVDVDGDGHPADFVGGDDCEDSDAEVHPGIPFEVADGVDEDCDGLVDERTSAFDDDGDGYTEVGGDCEDSDVYIAPGAVEHADGFDEDCDRVVDEETAVFDDDGDGFSESDGDCNDADASVAPGLIESRADGVDEDCDGEVDEETDVSDDDRDGVSKVGGDCDDGDDTLYPGATEILDGVDQDCDGAIDEGLTASSPDPLDTDVPPTAEDPTPYTGDATTDDDGDGYSEAAGDCDDARQAVSPSAPERCTVEGLAAIDENCDGTVDEGCDEPAVNPAAPSACGCATQTPHIPLAPIALVSLVFARRRRQKGSE